MTYHALTLDDFANPRAAPGSATMTSADAEALRLEGYEAGYKSGWDDATKEADSSDRRIAADLERNLADLSFTYEEARAEVLRGMGGLFGSILESFLPELAAAAVLPRMRDELDRLLPRVGTGPLTIIASPETAKRLEYLAETYLTSNLHITPEPAYPDARVALRHAAEETEIDLAALVAATTAAIRDFAEDATCEKDLRPA
ncbi:hypothetical protein [Nioella sp.]|uniref:hypothetical protein n=2 Tax=Nioella sp. TaxID=1912091 RepID=UPI00355A96A4